MTPPSLADTPFRRANQALRAGEHERAIALYLEALGAPSAFDDVVLDNLALARRRLMAQRVRTPRRPRVLVLDAAVGGEAEGQVGAWAIALAAAADVVRLATVKLSSIAGTTVARAVTAGAADTSEARAATVGAADLDEMPASPLESALSQVMAQPCDAVLLVGADAEDLQRAALCQLVWGSAVLADRSDPDRRASHLREPLPGGLLLAWGDAGIGPSPDAQSLEHALSRALACAMSDALASPAAALLSWLAANRAVRSANPAEAAQAATATRLASPDRLAALCRLPIAGKRRHLAAAPAAPHPAASPGRPKVAIVVHIYYPDLWPEIEARLLALATPFDLFVTVPAEVADRVVAPVLQAFPAARLQIAPNGGMDVLPFLTLVPALANAGYLAVCKLHTKRGHGEAGVHWRRLMLDSLVGCSDNVALAVGAFALSPSLAMVGPAPLYLSAQRLMYGNEAPLQTLHQGLHPADAATDRAADVLRQDWGFFAGSMFWVRPQDLLALSRQVVTAAAAVKRQGEAGAAHDQGAVASAHQRAPSAADQPWNAVAAGQGATPATPQDRLARDGRLEHACERYFGLLPALAGHQIGLLHAKGAHTRRCALQIVPAGRDIGRGNELQVIQQSARLAGHAALIRHGRLFEPAHYHRQFPALRDIGADPVLHYLLIGRFAGAEPSSRLRSDSPELVLPTRPLPAGKDALVHFIQNAPAIDLQTLRLAGTGARPVTLRPNAYAAQALLERRNHERLLPYAGGPVLPPLQVVRELRASPLFDEAWYARTHLGALSERRRAVYHYLRDGAALGLDPSPGFDTRYYLAANPDVRASGINPLLHYLWNGQAEGRYPTPPDLGEISTEQEVIDATPVAFNPHAEPLADPPVRLVCFYLPQFHAIPENDRWWGEGFTEWTNVRSARPQFAAHHQPVAPGELGYYDLLDPATQRRQVALARHYGIGGFCFYVYWFGGKRLLEKPVDNYLADAGLDLPFCLCWANENWTRRWDGLDQEVLIGQQHSADDDLAFIAAMAPFLRDRRAIRIDGRPLLLIYRPSLLPDIRETAQRWRRWCRESGIGEIHLAYPQSFDSGDPRGYGLDSAIEFPPNRPAGWTGPAAPLVTEFTEGLAPTFSGQIYDWRMLPKIAADSAWPDYPLIRSVNPGWDNTPRKRERGTVLAGNSPRAYQGWLHQVAVDTLRHHPEPADRLVFVNAWNEWAEGAYLEPDQRHGHAYLEATRLALLRAALTVGQVEAAERAGAAGNDGLGPVSGIGRADPAGRPALPPRKRRRLAVVIHAYYPELLPYLLDRLAAIDGTELHLEVSCSQAEHGVVAGMLERAALPFHLIAVENRGRDVLPFVRAVPRLLAGRHDVVLKLHTKKSLHRADGGAWREQLYARLLDPAGVLAVVERFAADPRLGIVGPEGHMVPMSAFWGVNEKKVLQLSARIGIDRTVVLSQSFVAGSMFFARLDALRPLVDILDPADFEPESGQIDGTLAHAVERAWVVSALCIGQELRSTARLDVPVEAVADYRFARRSG